MQTNLKVLALAATMLASSFSAPSTAHAAEPTAAPALMVKTVRTQNAVKMSVIVQNTNKSVLHITLKDAKGITYYESFIGKRENGKALLLDLSELADGQYTLEVKGNDTEKITKTFELATPDRTLALK